MAAKELSREEVVICGAAAVVAGAAVVAAEELLDDEEADPLPQALAIRARAAVAIAPLVIREVFPDRPNVSVSVRRMLMCLPPSVYWSRSLSTPLSDRF